MTMTQVISGAELKVRLGGLGLPPTWFAERVGVTMRTVVRWFDGEDVSPNVADELENVSEITLKEMHKMVEKANIVDNTVTLKTYRTDDEYSSRIWPASWHRALTFRLLEHFRAQDYSVHIQYK